MLGIKSPAKKSPMERFNENCETSEIWWDSSPLVFNSWSKKTIAEAPPERRAEIEERHARYYISDRPMEQLFRGVTTNPPLSWAAWKEPVPEEVLEKLNKFKYFREGYEPDGLEPPQFNTHSSTVATATQFSNATNEMESFVEEALKNADIKSKVQVVV